MKKGYVKCSTADIYYEIYGEGRTLLFLHGNSEDMNFFKNQKEYLQKKYKLVFIDSRGHGMSTFGDEKLTLNLMSKDILKVIEELNLDKIDLIGFSDGGNLGIILALKNQKIFRTLTLVGANLKPEDLIMSERIQIKKEIENETDKRKRDILNLMVDEPNIECEELKDIVIPTLVVAGEHDLIKDECTRSIAYNLRNSRLEIIRGADHFLMDKKPKEFDKLLADFLEKN